MGENSKIEWCDHTFNPWRGCTKVSPGCAHCYAETLSKRNPKTLGVWGPGKPRVLASVAMWRQPLKWNDETPRHECPACGTIHEVPKGFDGLWECACSSGGTICRPVRRRVFCASLADWLDEEVPHQWRVDLLNLIARTPNLDWLLLTKRIESWRARMQECAYAAPLAADWLLGVPPPNVWLGTSVEDQARANERIPELLNIPARVRFLSCEPLLGAVNLRLGFNGHSLQRTIGQDLHWVIAGGESGPGARPMHPDWVRSLRDQCAGAGVPFLFKQWGAWRLFAPKGKAAVGAPFSWVQIDGGMHSHNFQIHMQDEFMENCGKSVAGRLLDGVEHNGFPKVEGGAV